MRRSRIERCAIFFAKNLEKNVICPLDIYGSICYNNSVRRAVQNKSPRQKEVRIMKFASIKKGIRITEKMAQKLAINWYYETKKYCYELQYGEETMDGDYERSIVRWKKGEEYKPSEVVATLA